MPTDRDGHRTSKDADPEKETTMRRGLVRPAITALLATVLTSACAGGVARRPQAASPTRATPAGGDPAARAAPLDTAGLPAGPGPAGLHPAPGAPAPPRP